MSVYLRFTDEKIEAQGTYVILLRSHGRLKKKKKKADCSPRQSGVTSSHDVGSVFTLRPTLQTSASSSCSPSACPKWTWSQHRPNSCLPAPSLLGPPPLLL